MQSFFVSYQDSPGRKPFLQVIFQPLAKGATSTQDDLDAVLLEIEQVLRTQWKLRRPQPMRRGAS